MNGSGYTIVQAGAEVPAEEFVRRYVDCLLYTSDAADD